MALPCTCQMIRKSGAHMKCGATRGVAALACISPVLLHTGSVYRCSYCTCPTRLHFRLPQYPAGMSWLLAGRQCVCDSIHGALLKVHRKFGKIVFDAYAVCQITCVAIQSCSHVLVFSSGKPPTFADWVATGRDFPVSRDVWRVYMSFFSMCFFVCPDIL